MFHSPLLFRLAQILAASVSGWHSFPGEVSAAPADQPANTPNIVVILVDDLGYADIGPFGADRWPTPALDRMAREGRRFTDFVVSSAVCSASRAALLTGCYHERVGISGALGPRSPVGLAQSETTLAEICRAAGYATACFGKWHLGCQPGMLPLHHGFDEYYGLPYSNDMWPLHPDHADLPADAVRRKQGYPALPMYEGNDVCDPEVDGADQAAMTAEFTRRSVDFIQRHRDRPFFLYLAHPMVHVPLFTGEAMRGRSGAGAYGDAVGEVDWSTGEILETLRKLGLDGQTLVVFTSDNGPWLSYGEHAGSAGILREGKGTSWEGGIRVPTVLWWPGRIPAGTTCPELASTIDLLPTACRLLNQPLPPLPVDGCDISDLIFSRQPGPSPHQSFYCYYANGELQAVRDRRWKLVLPHSWRTLGGKPGGSGGRPAPYEQRKSELQLFDLQTDPAESADLSMANPEVVARLLACAEQARADLGDSLTQRTGSGTRAPDRIELPDPGK